MRDRDYTPHVRPRGEERSQRAQGKRARRWVVEVAHSWFTRFRKLLVRFEKMHRSYLALSMLAAAIITFRRVRAKINIIYG
jgi:transposase